MDTLPRNFGRSCGSSVAVLILLALQLCAAQAQPQPSCPTVGAIRWDAWHGDDGEPGLAVERSLGPDRWHGRVPFFGKILGMGTVEIEGDRPSVMKREISFAEKAGLDYWAFVAYDPESPMTRSLDLFLASRLRHALRFSMIITSGAFHPNGRQDEQAVTRLLQLMEDPRYMRVLGDRPLVYLGFIQESGPSGIERFERFVRGVRDGVKARRLSQPYFVVMDFDPNRGRRWLDRLGLDAISSYAVQCNEEAAPFRHLASCAARFWERARATRAAVVPLAMTGWDRRPRVEHPVPWERHQPKHPQAARRYYASPTPLELARHVSDAVDWVARNPQAADARTVLVYAWNENDEGGWLVPTLGEGNARVDALGEALRQACPTAAK